MSSALLLVVEASPENAARLGGELAHLTNVKIINRAVWREKGEVEFLVADQNRAQGYNRIKSGELQDFPDLIHGDTAIAWGLFTIMAEPAEGGDAVEMKGRYMDIARNMYGTWLYVADHASLPIPAPEN